MEINNPRKNEIIDEFSISSKRKDLNINEDFDEMALIKEKNNLKISLRKKKNMEYLTQKRKERIKNQGLFLKINCSINYDELLKLIPEEIVTEFNTTKNKYSFFLKYLSLTEKEDPNFYITIFVIYQIHILTNNDITNSSLPSEELLRSLMNHFFHEYKNEQLNQMIQIQNEIIQMLIIWVSYDQEDNINSIFYDDYFISNLLNMIENNIYNIEFKINILQLFNVMIKGKETFNKIIAGYTILDKIEKILVQINKDEQYIFVFKLIFNIFNYLGEDEDEVMRDINIDKKLNQKIIIFQNSYDKFIILLNHYYKEYQNLYNKLKENKTPISLDPKSKLYYKIVIYLLKIINNSLYLKENIFYIYALISNQYFIPLILKLMEKFSEEFFNTTVDINDKNLTMEINNNISMRYEPSLKIKENNNLFKKFKTITFITHIFTEIISSSEFINIYPNFKEAYNNAKNLIINFNIINYYKNLIKNFICFNVKPDYLLILRMEEFIYNFCDIDKNNYKIIYKNYELIRELLSLNDKYFDEETFDLLIKFIINSLSLYETEITGTLVFDIKVVSFFVKFLENELGNSIIKYKNKEYIFYLLKEIISSNTYRNCKLNRNLIIYEFNKNNANKILAQYANIYANDDTFNIINDLLNNLDETDLLDKDEIEDLYN